jgi:hypothetical protein
MKVMMALSVRLWADPIVFSGTMPPPEFEGITSFVCWQSSGAPMRVKDRWSVIAKAE